MPSDPPPDHQLTQETRAVIERAERAWQRQVEREEKGSGYGRMTPLRWIMLAIAGISLILWILTNW